VEPVIFKIQPLKTTLIQALIMYKINSFVMPIHTRSGATIVTSSKMRMGQRVLRLKRELKKNQQVTKL
jgi:hypothetical protein